MSRMSRRRLVAPRLLQPLHGPLQLALAVGTFAGPAGRGLVEVGEAHIADALRDHEGIGHGVQGDRVANHRELERGVVALAQDRDVDRRPLGTSQALDRVVDGHAPRVLGLDPADDVARANAQAMGRGPLEGRHHRDVAVHRLHGDPEPVVLALLPLLQARVLLRLEEVRVGVESAEHLADREGDEAVALDLFRVVLLDRPHDRGVEAQLVGEAVAPGQHPGPEDPSERRAADEKQESEDAQPGRFHLLRC